MVCPNPTLSTEDRYEGFFLVPVIAVFTKYDQFKREINFKLEDQGLDTSTNPGLLNTELERVFEEQYLTKLRGSAPFVHLESKNFFNHIACTMLIC